MSEDSLSRRGLLQGATGVAAGSLFGSLLAERPVAAAEAPKEPAKKMTILGIGAHMDDCEIGAGGAITKAVKNGHRVVLVTVCSDFSTFRVTRGREQEVKDLLVAQAAKIGVEKRFLGYGYQQIADDLKLMKELAEIVADVKPDITFIHSRFERDRSPSDHSTVGILSERSVRNPEPILGYDVPDYSPYRKEIYAYEVYPQPSFVPDVFIDIRDVLKPTIEGINFFGVDLYGKSPTWPTAGRTDAVIQVVKDGWELPLTHYGEMKYAMSVVRGYQSGTRFAEGFRALDPVVLGQRILEKAVS